MEKGCRAAPLKGSFTRKPDGSCKLTVKECVTDIPEGEFSAGNSRTSPIIQRLAEAPGKAIGSVLTAIELYSTLKTIGSRAFTHNPGVTGYLNTSGTPRSDLDAIFGSEITTSPNGYQDLEGNPHP